MPLKEFDFTDQTLKQSQNSVLIGARSSAIRVTLCGFYATNPQNVFLWSYWRATVFILRSIITLSMKGLQY